MNLPTTLLTFAEHDSSPLSIRAKALVFVDPLSRALQQRAAELAPRPEPLLIRGENGTGKELLARHLHRESGRDGLFVPLGCTSLSLRHGEAELFGQARSATRGSRAGWLGSANGGTLYLDEVAALPQALQQRLLDCLQRGEWLRPGDSRPQPLDVRLIAASSVEPERAVQAGRLHPGLHALLSGEALLIPPLHTRPADILPLAEYFLGVYAQRLGSPATAFSAATQARLEAYRWPGNIRELENQVQLAVLVARGEQIEPQDLALPA